MSSHGRVQRTKTGKGARRHILCPLDVHGRYNVALSVNGSAKKKFIHRLVAEAFLGPAPADKPVVNHKDGNPKNNILTNLEWASISENYAHYQYQLGGKGLKLNLESAEEIRRLYAIGNHKQIDLAKQFNVPQAHISRVIRGQTWVRAGTPIPKESREGSPVRMVTNQPEKWRVCTPFTDYEVSSYGRVRRCTPARGSQVGHLLTPTPDKAGYPQVCLRPGGKLKIVRVHTLVCRAFHGPPPEGRTHVNHKDRHRDNNIVENLEWVSGHQNVRHAFGYSTSVIANPG